VADWAVNGADNDKLPRQEQAIARAATAITAFVGRTLKGPINRPVTLSTFADFQRVFGGLWQPAPLSYAVEQYFDNGGKQAIVVRIANGGQPPTITLPGPGGALTLIGLHPGTREYLRAAVDYDGIGPEEAERFNLVVQQLRAAGTELIEEQETFRRVSIDPGADRYVPHALAESLLVRVRGDTPAQRPTSTPGRAPGATAGYVATNPDGDDGAELTDYDLIGDPVARSGLFALSGVEQFNLLCLPALTRERDAGLPALLVALRLCRARQAMLIVDPPSAWSSAEVALQRLPDWPFFSEDALMYFPRVLALDKLRGRFEVFGSSGAVAGMLAHGDDSEELALRANLRPAAAVTDAERLRFAQAGVNVLPAPRGGSLSTPRTLVPESALNAGGDLAARRVELMVAASIERGTRWVVFEPSVPALWTRVQAQVHAFLAALDAEGAFVGNTAEERYFVVCDERLNGAPEIERGHCSLLYGFAAIKPGDFHARLVTHRPGVSRVRAVSVNRLVLGGARIEVEFETAILRGLVYGSNEHATH
jgi:phage tail sheath protein FI